METAGLLLAAGQGTRMKSKLPKVLHPILGRPMILYAIESLQQATGSKPVVVIGHGAELIRQSIGEQVEWVLQQPQLGTGHAVQQAQGLLQGRADQVLVTTADMPLMRTETLRRLLEVQSVNPGPITMLTLIAPDARGFGRIVRDAGGRVAAIVEEAQATPEQLAIHELNASAYCFNATWLWEALPRIPLSPKGEYYLTDLVGLAVGDGLAVEAIVVEDTQETIGINTRVHLAEAEGIMRQRINRAWMEQGVSMVEPSATYIEPGVQIGRDTIIWPNTYLHGVTRIGEDCIVGPDAIVRDCQIGDGCKIVASVLEGAVLEDEVEIGPYSHLRKGAHLAQGVHLGNFGEVKESYIGPRSKMGHFSYIGDTKIGADVNIGAGTVTCNYDGVRKNPTEIGDGAFIGSDTMLVAPVKVGDRAQTGAGAVVTKDVAPGTLVVGMPARAIRKLREHD